MAAVFLLGPKEIEIEAKDLAAIISSDEVEQYAGDTFIVHGFIFRDTRDWSNNEEDGYYSVCDDPNDENSAEIVVFKYKDGIADDIGTGSEVIVTGTLDEDGVLLLATNIEIVKKVDPVLTFADVDELLAKSNDLINKKVQVVGLLDNTLDDGVALLNDAEDKGIVLQKLSKPKDMEYGIYTITGKFYYKDGNATIDVEKYQLEEARESVPYFDSLEELLALGHKYRDKKISVNGYIQCAGATAYMMSGELPIELKGVSDKEAYELNGGYTVITGILRGGQHDPFYIEVEQIGE